MGVARVVAVAVVTVVVLALPAAGQGDVDGLFDGDGFGDIAVDGGDDESLDESVFDEEGEGGESDVGDLFDGGVDGIQTDGSLEENEVVALLLVGAATTDDEDQRDRALLTVAEAKGLDRDEFEVLLDMDDEELVVTARMLL